MAILNDLIVTGNARFANSVMLGTTSIGSSTQPIYLNAGVPTAIGYTIEKSVPGNAIFTDTDTTYSAGTGIVFDGTIVNHSNAITAGSVGSAQSPSHGGTFAIPKITYDAQGHITGATTVNITLPADTNTDTNVTNTASAATKFYVTGTTSSTTNTGTQYFDTGVYVSTTAGELVATKFTGDGSRLTGLNAGNIGSGVLPVTRGGTGKGSISEALANLSSSKLTLDSSNALSGAFTNLTINGIDYAMTTDEYNTLLKLT